MVSSILVSQTNAYLYDTLCMEATQLKVQPVGDIDDPADEIRPL